MCCLGVGRTQKPSSQNALYNSVGPLDARRGEQDPNDMMVVRGPRRESAMDRSTWRELAVVIVLSAGLAPVVVSMLLALAHHGH
jgi:hypothetical protein